MAAPVDAGTPPPSPTAPPPSTPRGPISWLIAASARHRMIVFVVVALAIAAGAWSVRRTSLDAIPDLSDVQVTVFT